MTVTQSQGFESLIQLLDTLLENPSSNSNDAVDDSIMDNYNQIDIQSISSKIESMKTHLNEKVNQLDTLKDTLSRKKVRNDQKYAKLKQKWQEKQEELEIDFQVKREKILSLKRETEMDIANLRRKLAEEQSSINHIIATRDDVCNEYKTKLEQSHFDQRSKWEKLEKRRLEKLARDKAEEMKQDAAKALEPDLRNMIEDHRLTLSRARSENVAKLNLLEKQMKDQYDEDFSLFKNNLELEQESIFLEIETDYKAQIEAEIKNHDQNLKEVTNSLKTNIEILKTEHRSSIEQYLKQNQDEIKEIARRHEILMAKTKLRNGEQLELFIDEMRINLNIKENHMKSDVHKYIEDDRKSLESYFESLLIQETERIQKAVDHQIDTIKTKLMNNLASTKNHLQMEYNQKKQAFVLDLDKELKQLRVINMDEHDHDEYKYEKTQLLNLKQELQHAKEESLTLDSELHRSLEALDKKKNECMIKHENEIKPLEHMIRDIRSHRNQLCNEKRKLSDTLISTIAERKDEVRKASEKTIAQVTLAERKIDEILSNKRKILLERKEYLSKLVSESDEYDARIRSIKKGLYC